MSHTITEERVPVTLPGKTPRGDPNFFVSLNGVNYLLPRGKTSFVPAPVAEEIFRAERAKEKASAASEELQRQGR